MCSLLVNMVYWHRGVQCCISWERVREAVREFVSIVMETQKTAFFMHSPWAALELLQVTKALEDITYASWLQSSCCSTQ